MGSKRWPLPVVLLSVLVLGLGTAGTATAGGLTTRAVKKIAAKVVVKKAKKLSVAHATTADSALTASTATSAETASRATTAGTATSADNAQTVGGFTADRLRTTGYRYTLTTSNVTASHTWSFPALPPGTYLASWSLETGGAATNARIDCAVHPSGNGVEAATATTTTTSSALGRISASAVLTTTAGVYLVCAQATGTYSLLTSGVSQNTITFIPVDTLVVDGTSTGS